MSNLINFKSFVKNNPSLIRYVKNGEMTWQKFYEFYDLYGENNSVWDKYILPETTVASAAPVGISEIASWFKSIDISKMQEGINSVQRVIGVLQDFGNNEKSTKNTEYKPRPIYKHFED